MLPGTHSEYDAIERIDGVHMVQVMAVGGISTIVLGLGSQIVTANAISGGCLVKGLP